MKLSSQRPKVSDEPELVYNRPDIYLALHRRNRKGVPDHVQVQ